MKQKINLRLFIIALIAVLGSAAGVTFVYYSLFRQQVRKDLRITTELLGESGRFQEIYAGDVGFEELIGLRSEEFRITWIDRNGTVLFDNGTDQTGLSNHLDRPEVVDALKFGSGESVRRSDTMNMDNFYYALKLTDGTVLRVSTQAQTITGMYLAAMPIVSVLLLAVLLLCVLLSHFLTISILKPISLMTDYLDEDKSPMDIGNDANIYKELVPFAKKIRTQHDNILESAKVRQDFTANVSHELKTPLTAISGYAELIENHLTEPGQEEHIARQIRNSSDRLLNLINDIIRLSELDHPELPRQMEPADLHETACKCCDALQIMAQQKGVTLRCDGDAAIVNADKALLSELIDNLVRNAIQYNNEGGKVDVFAGTLTGRPVLSVKDNGIGIPKELQARVFERFYRVDKGRSRELGGTGLGLAIVKHIAQIHDAEIILDSEEGKGTEITVKF